MVAYMSFLRPKVLFMITVAALSVAGLSACTHNKVKYSQAAPLTLTEQLRLQGVQVIRQGDRLQLVLPTDKFFRLQSTQIKENKIQTLNLVAKYLKQYLKPFRGSPKITVSGNTDKIFTKQKRYALSKTYAEVVASYLWNQDFSHQQLRVQGHAATHPIASGRTSKGAGYNRRVMIQVN